MKLTRIQIAGFKSFADHVDLPFDEGMTAVVGPNGCGKSNISDAVRWVLGEQRARLLRGAKMEEVIFHGAAKHRPVNVAEVSLHFDNSDGTLPVSFQEVVLTRRLSRSGQSDYLINQAPVRLRDVQDLLRGTGLGSDAGVVIEAQMIERLLSDKAEERRSLFEEAAGIGLYRDRKTSTERQLQRTAEDLQRLDDIISEVQREVRSLARQRGKAERYATFTADRFAIVMTLARHDLAQLAEREAALAAARERLATRTPAARDGVATREREREGCVQERATAEARRTEVERRLGQARLDAGRLEGDLNLAGERLQHAADRKARAAAEREAAQSRAAQATRDREAAETEHSAATTARASVQTELDLRTATEEDARTRLAQARAEVRAREETLQRLAERHRALAGEAAALTRELEDLEAQTAVAAERRDALAGERERAVARCEATRVELERHAGLVRAADAGLERARHTLAAARESESAARADRRAAEEAVAELTARREALEKLERERVGLAPAARRLLDERARFGEGAILGPLSDFLRTSQAEATLGERLLGDWLNAVLVRDRAVVDAVRAWHAAETPGPLVLLPADGPTGGSPAAGEPAVSGIGPAEAWTRVLLAGHDVLEPSGRAIRRPNGAVVLAGGDDAGGGPLARRADLEAVRARLEEKEGDLAARGQALEAAVQAHRAAETALAEANAAAESAHQALRDAQGDADDADRVEQRVAREAAEAATAATRLAELVMQRTARAREVREAAESADAERARVEEALGRHRTALADVESQQEAARERRVHWQVEEAQVSAREAAARERAERATAALAEAEAEMARLDDEVAGIERDIAAVSQQRQQWVDTLAERRVAVTELTQAAETAEAAVHTAERRLEAAERALAAARQDVTTLGEESHRIDLEATQVAGRREALTERIEGEWHRPIDQLLAEAPMVEGDLDTLRDEAARLTAAIEAIGPVNALAVEEHAEETKRLEFLTGQRDDLVEARARLQEALKEIDETARTLFVETFVAIREHFQTVFHTLFEGGQCDVRLADESDPLNSEIEIQAAPRGKRTQRIHLLSSGERALVAVSLLFSIYLAKPAPFCLLDEVDAPLDDANVTRFVRLLSEFKRDTQFIVITHNPRTMQVADAVFGVTMQEPGVSTIVGVRLGEPAPV